MRLSALALQAVGGPSPLPSGIDNELEAEKQKIRDEAENTAKLVNKKLRQQRYEARQKRSELEMKRDELDAQIRAVTGNAEEQLALMAKRHAVELELWQRVAEHQAEQAEIRIS